MSRFPERDSDRIQSHRSLRESAYPTRVGLKAYPLPTPTPLKFICPNDMPPGPTQDWRMATSLAVYHRESSNLVTCLATMAYVYAACTVCVTIFSTGGKFQTVSNFTELHALILAARSYALLAHKHFVDTLHVDIWNTWETTYAETNIDLLFVWTRDRNQHFAKTMNKTYHRTSKSIPGVR